MICDVNAVKRMFYDAIIFFCSLSFQELQDNKLTIFYFHNVRHRKLPVKLLGCSPKMLVVRGGWVGSLPQIFHRFRLSDFDFPCIFR